MNTLSIYVSKDQVNRVEDLLRTRHIKISKIKTFGNGSIYILSFKHVLQSYLFGREMGKYAQKNSLLVK